MPTLSKQLTADNRSFGSTLARHSFIMRARSRGSIKYEGRALTDNELKQIAIFMAHSESMQSSYDRRNIDIERLGGEKGEEDAPDTLGLPEPGETKKGGSLSKYNKNYDHQKRSKLTSAEVYKEVTDALKAKVDPFDLKELDFNIPELFEDDVVIEIEDLSTKSVTIDSAPAASQVSPKQVAKPTKKKKAKPGPKSSKTPKPVSQPTRRLTRNR